MQGPVSVAAQTGSPLYGAGRHREQNCSNVLRQFSERKKLCYMKQQRAVKLVSAMKAITFGMLVFSCGYYSDLQAQRVKQSATDQVLAVIPRPQTLTVLPGAFTITSKTSVCIDPANDELRRLAMTLLSRINASSGYALRIVEKKNSDATNAI